MPKTASNFNYLFSASENQIWLAGEISRMKAVAITHGIDNLAHSQFGFHPLAFYSAHIFAAPYGRDRIHKSPRLS
jgi:hypothetical protein